MLKVGRSRVRFSVTSLDSSVGLILRAAQWPWTTQLHIEMTTRNLPDRKGWPVLEADLTPSVNLLAPQLPVRGIALLCLIVGLAVSLKCA
jgi:hypothetical protein